ncbi:hypothetical protein D3C83_222410 [compost metagenome]
MAPGKIAIEKPSASSASAARTGVLPPSTMFASKGVRPAKRCVTAFISPGKRGASMNSTSAPASR